MISDHDRRFEPVPEGDPVPYPLVHGWLRIVGDSKSRIARSATIAKSATLGNGIEIGANVRIGSEVWIGDNAEIGRDAVVRTSAMIPSGTRIGTWSLGKESWASKIPQAGPNDDLVQMVTEE